MPFELEVTLNVLPEVRSVAVTVAELFTDEPSSTRPLTTVSSGSPFDGG